LFTISHVKHACLLLNHGEPWRGRQAESRNSAFDFGVTSFQIELAVAKLIECSVGLGCHTTVMQRVDSR
jgi:hypothetical protein